MKLVIKDGRRHYTFEEHETTERELVESTLDSELNIRDLLQSVLEFQSKLKTKKRKAWDALKKLALECDPTFPTEPGLPMTYDWAHHQMTFQESLWPEPPAPRPQEPTEPTTQDPGGDDDA